MPRPKNPEIPCGNPLFLSWVGEWLDNARAVNSKGVTTWKKAYESIQNCPIHYEHPSELIRLHGIGPGICKKLEDKLKAHCEAEGIPMPLKPGQTTQPDIFPPSCSQGAGNKRKAPVRQYIPKYRSGGYAILRALGTFPPEKLVTKAEITGIAYQYCDSPFDAPSESKFYTAWSSMKQLLEKGYVYKSGHPPKFTLTEDGAEVAKILKDTDTNGSRQSSQAGPSQKRQRSIEPFEWIHPDSLDFMQPLSQNSNRFNSQPPSRPSSQTTVRPATNFETRVLPAKSYSIQLIMDNREIHSQEDRTRLERGMRDGGVPYTVRSLDIGDALWIAKTDSAEYVLDYIVERKRMDDLVSSITDGRFHEQKFRLMKSGARHIIYVIEEHAGFEIGQFQEAVNTCISSTQSVNNFFVKRVKNIQDTINYLLHMSKALMKLHQNRPLTVIPESQIDSRSFYNLKANLAQPNVYHCVHYEHFCAITSKSASLNVGDLFLKMLMTIKGISAEKAIEIQRHFPTLINLVEQLASVGEEEGKKLVGERCSKYGRRKIGNVLSAKIYEVFRP